MPEADWGNTQPQAKPDTQAEPPALSLGDMKDIPQTITDLFTHMPTEWVDLQTYLSPLNAPNIKERKNSKDRLIRLAYLQDAPVSVISSPTKDQDSARIKITHDGRIVIAIADGVTRSAVPAQMACLLTETATALMDQEPLSAKHMEICDQIALSPRMLDIANSKLNYLKSLKASQGNLMDGPISTLQSQINTRPGATNIRVAKSMLVSAEYRPSEKRLRFVNRGDTRVVIIHQDGTHKEFVGRESGSFSYGEPSTPEMNDLEEIDLIEGDLILIETDGTGNILNYIKRVKQAYLAMQSAQRADITIQDLIKKMIDEDPDDDVTTCIIAHTSQ
jgi:hypothetical protein